jgi:FkbM family methyltransferase
MTLVSYAQNFEDVMLWRALKHVRDGFYIDVGANDPSVDSVTRAFYDAGWRGVNIEPVLEHFSRLKIQRPRDINLCIAAGVTAGRMPFYNVPKSGLATADSGVAQMHRARGWEVIPVEVDVLPLSTVCDKHVDGDIHFLKIDVEGAERDVLLGMDFERWRPWILIVESTVPTSQEQTYEKWEALLTSARYDFAYFDGLNRYYIASERSDLRQAFQAPPNVFDDYVLASNQALAIRAGALEQKVLDAQEHLHELELVSVAAQKRHRNAERSLLTMSEKVPALEHELTAMKESLSWRITRPLRVAKQALSSKAAGIRAVRAGARRGVSVARRVIARGVRSVAANARVRDAAVRTLARFPGVDSKVRALRTRIAKSALARMKAASRANASHGSHGSLSHSASRIFGELQRKVEKNSK